MPARPQQAAAGMQHYPSPIGLDWDWNDVRVFLACVKLGSFRKAADQLGLNSSTVVRRIEAFEHRLGFALLNRLHDGVSPTPAGVAILDSAERSEERRVGKEGRARGAREG